MDTITAIATPSGTGGIAVIRLSGPRAIAIADSVWRGRPLAQARSHTAHLGEITEADGQTLDQAVATVFHAGRSFTGEETVEFSIHGSQWLQREVLRRLIEAGARMATAGEFSQRAVINGRIDLAQAEGVADLIAASSRAAHRMATTQMKGDFSRRLDELRQQMIDLASLLELELDFSEEDVEFADRSNLINLCTTAQKEIDRLAASFRAGQALKEGIPVAIAGAPNAGKSTLLNRLLGDDKAIVTDIPGTTRDIIEDTIEIEGILYRFIDTAGLRETDDRVERIGIERAYERFRQARIILYLIDPGRPLADQAAPLRHLRATLAEPNAPHIIPILTKADTCPAASRAMAADAIADVASADVVGADGVGADGAGVDGVIADGAGADGVGADGVIADGVIADVAGADGVGADGVIADGAGADGIIADGLGTDAAGADKAKNISNIISLSAKTGDGINQLTHLLKHLATEGHDPAQELMVTNLRHYEALRATSEALQRTHQALTTSLPPDLIAQDLREAIHHLSLITGAITTDTLLHTIFARFCIGK